jgi:small-conductance mechanosensitive channel
MLILAALALWLCGASAAQAQQPAAAPSGGPAAAAGPLTPAEAKRAADVLQDPQKRAQLIETLQAISKALPAASPAVFGQPQPGQPQPDQPQSDSNQTEAGQKTTAPPAATPPPAPAPVSLAPDSLGAQLLAQFSSWPAKLANEATVTARAVTDFPLLWGWTRQIAGNPYQRAEIASALWHAAAVFGVALLLGWLARRLLARPLRALVAHAPESEIAVPNDDGDSDTAHPDTAHPDTAQPESRAWHLLRRLPFALARLALELIPVGIVWGVASLLSGFAPRTLARLAILVVANAYATAGLIIVIGRMLLSPSIERLRLLHIGDEEAADLLRWLRGITIVAVVGNAVADLALLFGLYEDAYDTVIRFVALIVAVLVAIFVLRMRQSVARHLRPPPDAEGSLARWRNWFAGVWHFLALIAIIAGWILWAAGIRNGLGGLRVLIGTVAILVIARLAAIAALGIIDRLLRLGEEGDDNAANGHHRRTRYHTIGRIVVTAAVTVGAVVTLLQFWGVSTFRWFESGQTGARLVSAVITITIAALAAIIVWEGANAALERRLARLSEAGSIGHSARLRTVLPILRAILFTTIVVIVGLTALSEIGVNIAPLLAGAGIIGVAVGFGSQKLVQDVITGMFVLFENAIQIGDTVTVASLTGNVERLSVRTIWLRGADGAVHIIPFSAVTSITNTNRGLGNAAVSVIVAYDEDTDRVTATLKEIVEEMRADPAYSSLILGDLRVWVDQVRSTGVSIAGLIGCTDSGRWPVQREFSRRLQKRFRELGIELGTIP